MKLVVLTLTLMLISCGKKPDSQTNPVYLYAYGDSISYGLVHPNYVESVAQSHSAVLFQKSIGGTEMTDRNQHDTIISDNFYFWSKQDTVVLFAPGLNDAILNHADPTYMALYEKNLVELVNWMHWSQRKAFIGTPNHVCDETRFVTNSIVDQYADINRRVVKQINDPNIVLVDYNAEFTPSIANTLDCGHPNELGNSQMARILMNSWK
jgi:lysophospholipase L1-like esterase